MSTDPQDPLLTTRYELVRADPPPSRRHRPPTRSGVPVYVEMMTPVVEHPRKWFMIKQAPGYACDATVTDLKKGKMKIPAGLWDLKAAQNPNLPDMVSQRAMFVMYLGPDPENPKAEYGRYMDAITFNKMLKEFFELAANEQRKVLAGEVPWRWSGSPVVEIVPEPEEVGEDLASAYANQVLGDRDLSPADEELLAGLVLDTEVVTDVSSNGEVSAS